MHYFHFHPISKNVIDGYDSWWVHFMYTLLRATPPDGKANCSTTFVYNAPRRPPFTPPHTHTIVCSWGSHETNIVRIALVYRNRPASAKGLGTFFLHRPTFAGFVGCQGSGIMQNYEPNLHPILTRHWLSLHYSHRVQYTLYTTTRYNTN